MVLSENPEACLVDSCHLVRASLSNFRVMRKIQNMHAVKKIDE
jgi:hypothetical protein